MPYDTLSRASSWIRHIGFTLCMMGLAGCNVSTEPTASVSDATQSLKIGIMAGPQQQIFEKVAVLAKERFELSLEFIPFSNYMLPNVALDNGELDANIFQTVSFLSTAIHRQQLKIRSLGGTFIYPMRLFSQRIDQLSAIALGSQVGIPLDPSNADRALRLLAAARLIELPVNEPEGKLFTVLDITSNPFNLQIRTLDAAELPRVLPDVALVALNNDFVSIAGLHPDAALFSETAENAQAYINVVAVRVNDDRPSLQQVLSIMRDPEIVAMTQQLFPGAIPVQ